MSRILSESDLQVKVSEWRAAGLTIGFTCGAFDLLHAGHADYLQRARSMCDRLIVAVNSDESIRLYKNPLRPIVGETHRMQLIAALASVDAVTPMHDTRPIRLLKMLQPALYIKGGDYTARQLRSASEVEAYGGRCVLIPVNHEISSSAIIARIEDYLLHAEPTRSRQRAANGIVFLDRDGTLIENVPFLQEPGKVRLLPGVLEGLRLLQERGFLLVIATNQQGIGLGYFSYNEFVAVNSELLKQLSKGGIRISRIYYCPHSHADHCDCRKPGAKLLNDAMSYFNIPPGSCFLIGDADSDLMAAENAGCQGLLVNRHARAAGEIPLSFMDAVERILSFSLPAVTAEVGAS